MTNKDNFSIPIDSSFNIYSKLNSKENFPSILTDRSLKNKIQENLFYKTKSTEINSISISNKKINSSNESSKEFRVNSSNNIRNLKNEIVNKSRNKNQNSLFKSSEQKDLISSSNYFKNIGNNLMSNSNSVSKDRKNNNNFFNKEFKNNINNNNNDYFAQNNENTNNKNNFFNKKGGIFINNRYNSNNEIPMLKFEGENCNKITFTPVIVKGKKKLHDNYNDFIDIDVEMIDNNDNNNNNNYHQKNSLSYFSPNSEFKINYKELNKINNENKSKNKNNHKNNENENNNDENEILLPRHKSQEKSNMLKFSLENENNKNNNNYKFIRGNSELKYGRNRNDFDINQFNSENSNEGGGDDYDNYENNNNNNNYDNYEENNNIKNKRINLINNIKTIDKNDLKKTSKKKSNILFKINKGKTNLINNNKNNNNNNYYNNDNNDDKNNNDNNYFNDNNDNNNDNDNDYNYVFSSNDSQTLKEKYNDFINKFNRTKINPSKKDKNKENYFKFNNNNITPKVHSNSQIKFNPHTINLSNEINQNNNNNNNNSNNKKKFITKTFSLSQAGIDEKGRSKTNQDSCFELLCINNFENFNIFGVLDGHGSNGHLISQYVKKQIKTEIVKSNELKNCESYNEIYEKIAKNNYRFIRSTLKNIENNLNYENDIDNTFSGTTCIIVINIYNKLIVVNIGDSRAIMVCEDKKIINLSKDHKPLVESEKKRIESKGGEIYQLKDGDEFYGPFRVWVKGEKYPGIAMSRSIGDAVATEIGVISVPDIKEFNIDNNCKYAIIASDGLYEFLSNEKIAHYANKYYRKNDVEKCCKYLIKKASEKWEIEEDVRDDITVVCMFF
jgi:serine/threonine protein phosphatase PrpC